MIITVLKAVIAVDAGWAVGAADEGAAGLDRELLVDTASRPWVPPSSLAGSLRSHLARHGADERLMGSRPPAGPKGPLGTPGPQLNPSALWLLGTRTRRDGPPESGEPPATTVEASTAIDPRRRAARPQSLRHSRVVDEPAVIELCAQFDGQLSAADLELLASWHPQVGRDRTRGGGAARLQSLGYRTYDLNDSDDLRAWLEAPGTGRFTKLTDVPVTAGPDDILIREEFAIIDALHIGTGSRRNKISVTRTRSGQPLVPASTWKGLFRARSGYIIRTCWGESAACTGQTGCGTCPLCDLFGSTARRGRIAFGSSTVTNVTRGTRAHVAIDRFTGGAIDQLLYTDEIITAGTVTLTITALETTADWQRDLLRHVVRDIHDGLVGIGGGAQRGQGTLRLTAAAQDQVTALPPIPAQPPGHQTATATRRTAS
jgi:CRISPR/Cas system CSM-associated protein Csm3 (group 7 of RAMP superfamily)